MEENVVIGRHHSEIDSQHEVLARLLGEVSTRDTHLRNQGVCVRNRGEVLGEVSTRNTDTYLAGGLRDDDVWNRKEVAGAQT